MCSLGGAFCPCPLCALLKSGSEKNRPNAWIACRRSHESGTQLIRNSRIASFCIRRQSADQFYCSSDDRPKPPLANSTRCNHRGNTSRASSQNPVAQLRNGTIAILSALRSHHCRAPSAAGVGHSLGALALVWGRLGGGLVSQLASPTDCRRSGSAVAANAQCGS